MSLPERPSFEQLKKQAKELQAAGGHASLAAAQLAVARSHGFPSWAALKRRVHSIELRHSIEDGDAERARALLASSPGLARIPFDDGSTPLHVAAGENRPPLVDVLLAHGARAEARFGDSAHTALSWAVTCWSFEAAMRLIETGVEPDLFCAAGLGLLDRVRSFWREGRLASRPSATGSSRFDDSGAPLPRPPAADADQVSDALYIACRCDRLEVGRFLLDHGADPNWRGYAGATCLAWAEFSGNAELCTLLRARGGSDALLDQQFRATPRAFAVLVLAGWGFPRKLAERLGADRSLVSLAGERGTALHAAAAGGQRETAHVLLYFGADRSARDAQGRTPAEVARAHGHVELAEKLA
jgi:ankyrin repeat protein